MSESKEAVALELMCYLLKADGKPLTADTGTITTAARKDVAEAYKEAMLLVNAKP